MCEHRHDDPAAPGVRVVRNPAVDAYRKSHEDGSDYTRALREESERGRRALDEVIRRRAAVDPADRDEAKRRYGSLPGVEGFGIGEEGLRIYVHDEEAKAQIPSTFGGTTVHLIVTGGVIPLAQ